MTDAPETAAPARIEHDLHLDAPPERVWRAVRLPAFRDRWLPPNALAAPEPVREVPSEAVTYRLRDPEPPHLESLVTFRLAPAPGGGTRFTIRHDAPTPANLNRACLARAA